ncbi:GAF domain-containing protein [Streptomonospora nanhaiensis]|uniref:PAS domain-containing protein n=1 Tax=Streptomonospora nanhaiensis TaxID=1323731 RepID=A0A853BSM2_9ACTN|nr:GAF domain-containing protein [Streptomonospora nanhaiensis]MBV2364934.1 GAF domain-containing protein [Streptomonospora nanhaiensis]MBX9387245.1 GAF domain-containing protein [Streptomonospora nanhaiensis]NYI97547.1 PAS domain-containing protein [Streptomonospora nanhaiensis]
MPENLADLQREISELSDRVAALRSTQAMYPGDAASTAEAVLAELGFAEELLKDCGRRLAEAAETAAPRRGGGDDERALLRAVFSELTVPVVLLDHEGYIRRINTIGAERLGSTPGYLSGKPFSNFVDLRRRAAMRSWLAAVLRNGESASFDSRLAQRGWAEDVHVTLTRLEVSTEAAPMVLVVMSPPLDGADDNGPAPLEAEVEDQVVVLAARRLDVLTRMTRLLLASAGPGGGKGPLALEEAAALLADSYADWVVVDVCDLPDSADRPRRAVVSGPPGEDAQHDLLAALDPRDSEIPGTVLASGKSVLNQLIEDETVLGRARTGAPVLSALGAGSMMCVPLRGSRGVRGALTLIRRSNRGSFRLADLGLIEEIGEHIGLALPPRVAE